ncbi:MAG: glycosyltransferase [Candidatus Aenigmarchaeota archaeon]|nr:glycosyltransferase [Candidatus Aenigmarchaeota archaeon]
MIDLLNPVILANVIDTIIKPPIYATSDFIFNITLIGATFFSVFFYLIAIDGMLIKNKKVSFKNLVKWPMVTIQIPTFNEPVAMRCAKKCLNFDYPKDKYEVIIGDDSNDKNVSRLIDKFAKLHKGIVKVTRRGNNFGYKAGNLNHMLKYSKGEIIVIFDSDFVPPKNFLREIVKPFGSSKKIGAVQARWDFLNMKQSIISRLASGVLVVYHHLILPIFNKNNVSFICGSAEAIRKDILIKLGGWESGSLTEDIEFSLRLMKAGYRNVYLKNLSAKGELPFNFKSFKKQQMRWSYGNTRSYLKHCRSILFNEMFNYKQKILISFILFGYVVAPLLALLLVAGMVSFATNTPGPIDVSKFLFSLGRNLLLTSGFIAATLIGLSRYEKMTPTMLITILFSSLTVGVMISFYMAKAFIKAILKKPMHWYMIQKQGNDDILTSLKV